MRACVITFPGSNCDRDLAVGFEAAFERPCARVWHGDSVLPDVDVIGVPGGFSYGDYLRCGAIASRSPIMADVIRRAKAGTFVIGICNGFQVLCEAGLLPGALLRNAGLSFVCRHVEVEVATTATPFTGAYATAYRLSLPVAHHDGNYHVDDEGLARLEGEGRVAFRYRDNPNGSLNDIAGIVSENGRVLGMMPHPERAIEPLLGSADGRAVFLSLLRAVA
jgi:phosphoribosylformylglycinamidine synthase